MLIQAVQSLLSIITDFPSQKINNMSTFLKIKEIDTSKQKSVKFATLLLYFPSRSNIGQLVYSLL